METMDRKPITEILAENLATAMAEHPFIKSQNALAKFRPKPTTRRRKRSAAPGRTS